MQVGGVNQGQMIQTQMRKMDGSGGGHGAGGMKDIMQNMSDTDKTAFKDKMSEMTPEAKTAFKDELSAMKDELMAMTPEDLGLALISMMDENSLTISEPSIMTENSIDLYA